MDIFKQLFDTDKAERSKYETALADRRNAAQSWLQQGLDQIHEAAKASGRMQLRQFHVLHGGTVEPVRLDGEVVTNVGFDARHDFSFEISWDSSESAYVTVKAGLTSQAIPLANAIAERPVDLISDVLEKELSRRRPTA